MAKVKAKAKAAKKAKAKDAPSSKSKAEKPKARGKVEAPVVKTSKKSKTVAKEEAKREFFRPDYESVIDTVEKKFKLGQGAMSKEARLSSQISTGLLCTDIMFGGGLLPGAWYTCFGGEGSAKSTHLAHIKIAAADYNVPVMADYDFEGSSAPDYYEGIFEFASTMKEIAELYGQKDDDGNWVRKPKVRYYSPNVAEDFFKSAASLLRRIPDKEFAHGRWWYVWDNDKEGKSAAKGQYSKKMLSKYGRLYIEAEFGYPQAIYFLDSYPAMYPEALDDDDAGRGMAAVARAMSENVPRILSKLRSKAITIVGVNQLRLRPGVSFGCLHYNSMIHFVDGRVLPIGEVVENRIEGEVWSMNEATQKLEPRRIKAWHNNGEVQQDGWLTIKTQGIGTKNGLVSITVTPNHEVLTDSGWKEAKDLVPGEDCVITKYESTFNGTRAEFLAGVLCGDSCIVGDSRSVNSSLRLQDSNDPEYVEWKCSLLDMEWKGSTDKRGFTSYTSIPNIEWSFLKQLVENRDPTKVADHITPLSLAVMYMDDGHYRGNHGCNISYKRFKNNRKKQAAILALWAKFGLKGKFRYDTGDLRFTVAEAQKLYKLIARYVPPCMQHKLSENWRGKFRRFDLKHETIVEECYAEIFSVEPGAHRLTRSGTAKKHKGLYDITVEGNHNYVAGNVANGIVVHNSPEYEPAGETVKFASSVRVRQSALVPPSGWTRDKENYELGKEPSAMYDKAFDSYRYIKMKTIKNKTSTPYITMMQRVWTNDGTGTAHGFDPAYDTYNYMRTTGQLTGTIKSLKSPLLDCKKPIEWADFKALIVLKGKELKAHCESLGLKSNPKLRENCFKQMASGKGLNLYFEHIRGGGDDDDDEVEESDDGDDDE